MKSDLLCSIDDIIDIVRTDNHIIVEKERENIRRLIAIEPVLLWGDFFRDRIRGREHQAASRVAHGVALKSGLISDRLLADAIEHALEPSDFFVSTYEEMVERWLDRQWNRLDSAGGSIGYFLCKKGGFAHFDQVKGNLCYIHQHGGNVRVLKGNDSETTRIVSELTVHGISVRLVQNRFPQTRYYLCDKEYLFFFSLPGRIFWGFFGSDPGTLVALRELYENEWRAAGIPEE